MMDEEALYLELAEKVRHDQRDYGDLARETAEYALMQIHLMHFWDNLSVKDKMVIWVREMEHRGIGKVADL